MVQLCALSESVGGDSVVTVYSESETGWVVQRPTLSQFYVTETTVYNNFLNHVNYSKPI